MNQELICNRNYVLKKVLSNDNYKNIIKDIIQSILEIEIKSIKINSYIDTLEKYIENGNTRCKSNNFQR